MRNLFFSFLPCLTFTKMVENAFRFIWTVALIWCCCCCCCSTFSSSRKTMAETRLKRISIYKRERLIEIMDKQNQVTRRWFSTTLQYGIWMTSIWKTLLIEEKLIIFIDYYYFYQKIIWSKDYFDQKFILIKRLFWS